WPFGGDEGARSGRRVGRRGAGPPAHGRARGRCAEIGAAPGSGAADAGGRQAGALRAGGAPPIHEVLGKHPRTGRRGASVRLSELLRGKTSEAVQRPKDPATELLAGGQVEHIPVDAIVPSPFQPRMQVDEEALAELAAMDAASSARAMASCSPS